MGRARIFEIWRRAETGPICPEKRFETKIFWPRLCELIKEYDIRYDPERIVPTDDTLIEDVYKAGMDFLLDVGILCIDTERIIKLEEDEIKEIIRNAPPRPVYGEGKDAVKVRHRKLEDKTPPKILARVLGRVSQEIAIKAYQSFAIEPIVDILNPQPVFETFEGYPVMAGSPFEMYAEICNVAYARTATMMAGRPGMPILGTPAATDTPVIGATHKVYGYRKHDGAGGGLIMPEMKTNFAQMRKAAHALQYGSGTVSGGIGYVGGLAGSPEGAVISTIAQSIGGFCIYNSDGISVSIEDARPGQIGHTSRLTMWGGNLADAAISRNLELCGGYAPCWTFAGGCTEMAFQEWAASAIGLTVCGQAVVGGGTNRQSAHVDCFTGLE
ncbi:MAG: monomethylamine:corrinoid methyltransferase, partial [Candidatus Bathyarchaeota archaeon]